MKFFSWADHLSRKAGRDALHGELAAGHAARGLKLDLVIAQQRREMAVPADSASNPAPFAENSSGIRRGRVSTGKPKLGPTRQRFSLYSIYRGSHSLRAGQLFQKHGPGCGGATMYQTPAAAAYGSMPWAGLVHDALDDPCRGGRGRLKTPCPLGGRRPDDLGGWIFMPRRQSEKMAMGHFLRYRAGRQFCVGPTRHCAHADAQILPGGPPQATKPRLGACGRLQTR